MSAPRLSPFRIGLLPVACATALVLTGCGDDAKPAADADRPCTAETSVAGASTIDLSPATVAVTSPGTGALRVPAPVPRTDAAQKVTLSTESKETSVVSGQNQPPTSTVESVTLPLTTRAGCTDPKFADFTFGTPTTPDTALKPDLAAFDGAEGGVRYADGLVTTELQIAPPKDAQAPASRAIEQSLTSAFTYSVPLPTTPIGTGATWRVTRTVTAATTVTQTMDVTMTSWTGDRLTLDVHVSEEPDQPIFRIPGSDKTLDLSRFLNAGSGTVVVDLTRPLPVSAEVALSGARELVGDDPAKPIVQQTSFTLRWTSPS
ncbi:hypothetical protein MYK68_12460 [Gordonia sp. PP30]|uniref:hypothetical protein n=2 Tax=Gordonia TaxID=2053 RepID=UPI001FFE3AC9|nr:hypothetical protein [Gordonia sp. PP30]UQE73562.1 hypothetical protein MYK68_12460 [Gordonia sp. PP30]